MSGGAFRDVGVAIERVAVLQQEKNGLEAEVTRLRDELDAAKRARKEKPTEATRLRAQLKNARHDQRIAREESERLRNLLSMERAEVARLEQVLPLERLTVTNRDAYVQRLQDERDELIAEVRRLREAATSAPRRSFLAALFGKR